MSPFSLRSLLLAAIVLSNCISWTASRHHYTHNVSGHRSRHRRQGAGLFLSASYVIPGGEGTGWGEWGEVSACSRTCGGGVASQKRICLQIGPDGQPQCTGGDTKYFSCQTQDCPAGSRDFREQQCSEFDDVAFRDIKYKWVPYTQAPNPCELNCMPHGERFYYRHRTKVVDGTRCNDESFDVCVNGTCQPVGCDMMLGSGAREDKCRECRGTGAYCHTTAGVLDTTDLRKGYNDMLLIPEGATSIVIAERGPSNNYLALRAKNGTYYLNGEYHIDFPRSLVIAGALWYYERSQQGFAAPDKLRCLGPTNEPLYLALLLQDENVGIDYEYSVPNELAPPRNKRYNWVHDEFTPCSAPCGGGFQTRNVTCRSREELEIVDEALCDMEIKPPTNQSCNTDKCAAEWTPQPWGECSKRCGKGGTRSREVLCTQIISNGSPSIVADKTCFDILGPKPALFEECNENATCPIWFTGRWRPCDKLCDEGKQTRQVVCYQKNEGRIEVLKDSDCEDEKPVEEQSCMLQPCDGVDWVVSEWIGCDTCLSTVRSRTAICATKERKVVNETFCSYHPTPETQEPCDKTQLPPCDVQWYATQWSKCSVDCGKGVQTRKVFCGLFDGASVLKVDDARCAGQPKYNDTKDCEIPKEKCPSKWFAGPWTACSKECGGGEQYRRVMCLRGGEPATDCAGDIVLDSAQSCNLGPCNEDELMPTSGSPDSLFDEDEDCIMEEDSYPEVGLDEDAKSTGDDIFATMFSDSPTEGSGSGMWTSSTAEHESTFDTESTLSTDELLTTGTGSTELDLVGSGDYSTDTTILDFSSTTEADTGATSNDTDSTDITGSTESTITDETSSTGTEITASTTTDITDTSGTGDTSATSDNTESTEGTNTTVKQSKLDSYDKKLELLNQITEEEKTNSEESYFDSSEEDNDDDDYSFYNSGSDYEEETGSTETGSTKSEDTSSTESESTSESGSTDGGSTVSGSTESSDVTTETGDTATTESGATSETTAISSETTETGTTETETDVTTDTTNTETTETADTSETASTTDITGTSEVTETGSTETTETGSTETTESGTTEGTETGSTETTETGSTETTETGSTETPEASGSTETTETGSTETTETGSTETPETTGSTETTETGSTETTETGSTETPETTESTETTETGSTESPETTETGSTETTETGSTETTETGSTETTETGSTETTESGSTETTETGSTETTEAYTGSTESTVSEETGSTETTETGSTVSSEGTESESTTEAEIETTPWDLASTVLTTKKPAVCKPRSCKRSKFGCCPDNKTAALGPFDEGCRKPQTCEESLHGCCPDGLSPAQGPANKGCPDEHCEETLFGCCESDGKTSAQGNDQEGCPPPPPPCVKSKYGCCKDETEAKGPGKQGCPETSTTVIIVTEGEGEESTTTGIPGSTEPTESCAESEFGCCFDNQTAATGPEKQGCPCDTTEFGCCPDGAQPAQGPSYEGCVKSCNTSTFGCCPDGKTPAHGPGHEGCCLLYAYGCCPDNYKPADGPHLEGCGCQYAQFGCCPDNVTVATGPGNKGCGCQYSEHGCCPDRHSEASGPNFEGCKCHTYQFGCCPDGVTIAAGPNGQGCYCQHSAFGCCGDEQTHAKGPNREGCDCATSKYGCCLDGVSEATGPKFDGCADKPDDRQAMCNLKFERGPCRNYSVGWYYDTEYGGCSRFWYGGCEGNGNRFSSKEECEDTCVSPPAKDACRLPQIKGACLGYNVRWYFDTQRETCSSFIYGGCLGNNNNFESLEKCRAQCEPERAIDQCSLSIERGRCAGEYPRWGYNKDSRRCEQFTWGGCEGNTNRFSTEAACMLRCNPPGKPQPECTEPQDVGNCTETEARWSFSPTENRCVPFYYTGCGGNGNKYAAKEQCEEACPSAFVPELCTLPASTGDCSEYREKWYFDTKDQRCRQFYYGGCGGNGNRFESEQECESRCTAVTTTPAPTAPAVAPPQPEDGKSDFCFLGIDPGPCNQMETKWGYDYTRGKCVSFQFGGCGGNQNNFRSEEDCTYYCRPTQDICQLPMLSGPCDESVMRWFYDAASDSCSQFTYGGCEGNDNRFETREECESRCKTGPAPVTEATTTTVKVDNRVSEGIPSECITAPVLEPCSRDTVGEVWYYDQGSNACSPHENPEYGEECRNTGVFYSQEACERSCGGFRNVDVCRYPMEAGPCTEYKSKYHYNATSRRCEEFAYGGCLGGPNRFSTEQECEQICMAAVDPCSLPAEPGNCLGNMPMWFYHQDRDECYQFVYGGCGGNDNKFDTRESCEAQCRRQPAAVVTTTTVAPSQTTRQYQPEPSEECRTPVSVEPCSDEYVYYYDEVKGQCTAAAIGGCTTSANVYRSEEECERRCGAFRGLDVCRAPLDPGPCRAAFPKFYFDAASGSCRDFTYGGCEGGPNRFSTSEECEEVCAGAGPAAECLAPVSVGERCSEAPERRWHYDVTRADCLVFSYQGCGGTDNNFRSYQHCAYLCRVQLSDSQICEQYAEECSVLETTCEFGVRRGVAAEGCERCECERQADCEVQRRECDTLRCSYGIQRFAGPDGCETCKCYEDPCLRNNCTSEEKCLPTAYRDPVTQEVLYTAQCVTNEIPDCDAYIEECSRLQCPYGVQRTRLAATGCERCSCVPEEVDCTPLLEECRLLQCTYGVNRTLGNDGCERCKCYEHPCAKKQCPSGERCVATPFPDPVTQEWRYSTDCRTTNKPGVCPYNEASSRSTNQECPTECRDDADCRGVLKCCARGCSTLCVPPEPASTALPSTTHMPEIPQAPQVSTETEPQIAASEGGKATLRCLFHGNPPPKITWRFGEITIDGDEGRYRLLSDGALEIVSLFRNDSGVYICIGKNELGTAEQQVTLTVADPVRLAAGIAGAVGGAVTGELGRPLVVRCRAYGYPPPAIYWYRGHGGAMVPYSTPVYEARGNDLTIKRLALDTLGEYECQAYNGEGKAATWRVAVQAYRPPGDTSPNRYLVEREPEVLVTPRAPATAPFPAAPPTTTRQPDFDIPAQYTVPVHTQLTPASTTISAGSQLSLPCEVDGYPEPEVYWTKDDVRLQPSDRMWITGSRLTVPRSEVSDSGVYTCHASNAYSSHSSYVLITVQEVSIPDSCVDNPTFANCALIVQSRFCVHKYYSKFCCKSCVEAGQLDPRDALMQGDQPFWRK